MILTTFFVRPVEYWNALKAGQQMSDKNRVYKVFYSKDIRKKKKVYNDGILVCQDKKTKLFTSQGECVITLNKKSLPQSDEQYTINNTYIVVIDNEIPHQEYSSGRIFVQAKVDTLTLVNKPNKKKQSLHKLELQIAKSFDNGLKIESFIYPLLRQHQIQGVNFMYECLTGLKGHKITGCILADFMGLGKTLQTLTLIRCLLIKKEVKKVLVLCPLTLLKVWQKECLKWMGNKLNPLVALGSSQEIDKVVRMFCQYEYRLLVASYQHFYKYSELSSSSDLMIFDEGHRLKNNKSKLLKKIRQSRCKKRVLLTGTPIQNNLDQLYTCITLVNPSFFDSESVFRNVFQKPIISGMAKGATQQLKALALSRTAELAHLIKEFSLRRKADVLQNYLPKKRQYQVFLQLTPLQLSLYDRILKKKLKDTEVLSYLNQMRKLFTHPILFKTDRFDNLQWQDCYEDCRDEISFKMSFIKDVAIECKKKSQKIVIVSYFTETLDFIELILNQEQITSAKLDGRLEGKERYRAIEHFIKSTTVLLLSGKAGGTGLTLTCASKMIIVEPDWNPSNDSQVMGRVWRQGQQREVQIFRLLVGCSFEEKILQRQQLKQSLAQKLIDQQSNTSCYDFFFLKQLFMEIAPRCLTYTANENQLANCQKTLTYINWSNSIFVKIIESHQTNHRKLANEFEQAQFQEVDSVEQDSGNQPIQQQQQDLDFIELCEQGLPHHKVTLPTIAQKQREQEIETVDSPLEESLQNTVSQLSNRRARETDNNSNDFTSSVQLQKSNEALKQYSVPLALRKFKKKFKNLD